MINPITLLANALGQNLKDVYLQYFEDRRTEFGGVLNGAARLVIERIGNSDALYHNTAHTMLVTLVGQEILRGRMLARGVTPEDWLHFLVALLIHDIGYVRGICRQDGENHVVINENGDLVTPPRGASDAFLAPYHIERGKIFVTERFEASPFIDERRLARAIELTRFPVPDDADHSETDTEAGLVRAADLIGQLADPFYHRKINALFHEFSEIGMNEVLGYGSPSDLAEGYPEFFWTSVEPYIRDGLQHLEMTTGGKQWIAHLHSNIFQVEHRSRYLGPFQGN